MYFTTITQNFIDRVIALFPKHSLNFNDRLFAALLSASISLTPDEKQFIIQTMPTLSQRQVDELLNIFNDEQAGLVELQLKHAKLDVDQLFEDTLMQWAQKVGILEDSPYHMIPLCTLKGSLSPFSPFATTSSTN